MAFFGKKFVLEKDENFQEFLTAIGVPAEIIQAALKSKPSQTITKDGDTYTLTIIDERRTKELKFVSGVEFDETVVEGVVSKTTINVDGNVITQQQKIGEDRSITIKREFDGANLVESVTTKGWDGVAHRYYKAA